MKAYILKLTFEDITPLIWRRVIMPADATFHRLHQTIQAVTNFQSTLSPYHFFGVTIDDYFITDNEVIRADYADNKYSSKKAKAPTSIKIDAIIEQHGEFLYTYDFGDDWRIRVELEEIVEDYYFGYPTLLDGEGTAPPEDVGGPPGYELFLEV
ncbi:plasmid pRiA4b ORF-3 family protein, partial [Microvirga sp. 3-52]|nr:plasmid pRiA4b ORF-3 family protein [Microvirga sp. 3-52]